jgi:phage shock protein PspC (stress-responsive transcriptional regulator)
MPLLHHNIVPTKIIQTTNPRAMKKTLMINIGNSIIHIEEDAYEMLTGYLNEIKQHFAKSADDFEIVTDIENRIAEMLNEILQKTDRKVVEIAAIQNVIAQMGRVQDFDLGDEETQPKNEQPNFANFAVDKKLFRDTDEGAIAGVCTGLGHYFNVEARWIRLIAFLLIFVAGTGALVYLILWIAIPRAVTRGQRMAMKGEATNLYGYKRSFDEELQAFKNNLNAAGKQFNPLIKQSGGFIAETLKVIGRLIAEIFRIAVKIIAFFIILFGFGAIIFLIISVAALMGFWSQNPFEMFPFSVVEESYRGIVVLLAFITLFIPMLVLVLFAIKVAFNRSTFSKILSFSLLVIWLLGVAGSVYYTTKILSNFQEHAELVKNIDIKPYKTLYINTDESLGFSKEDSVLLNIQNVNVDGRVVVEDFEDHPFRTPRKIRFYIEKTEGEKSFIEQSFEAQGKTFKEALGNAQNIGYQFLQKDSLMLFSPRLQLKQKATWRNQTLKVTLKVPVGTHLMLSDHIYDNLEIGYYPCNPNDTTKNSFKEWLMTDDGLKCMSQIREEFNKRKDLQNENSQLEYLQHHTPNDTIAIDSVKNKIREIKEYLGIETD